MHWWYKLIEKQPDRYVYAYSRENKDLDGVITYFNDSKAAEITKESATDMNIERRLKGSLAHFYTVVREGFPEERHICCG